MKWEYLSDEGLATEQFSSPCRIGAGFGAAEFPGTLAGEWNLIWCVPDYVPLGFRFLRLPPSGSPLLPQISPGVNSLCIR